MSSVGVAIGCILLVAALCAHALAPDPVALSAASDARLYSAQDRAQALARPVRAGWTPTLRQRLQQDCERSIVGGVADCDCYARVMAAAITADEYERFLAGGSARADRAGVRAYALCH